MVLIFNWVVKKDPSKLIKKTTKTHRYSVGTMGFFTVVLFSWFCEKKLAYRSTIETGEKISFTVTLHLIFAIVNSQMSDFCEKI